LPAGRVGQPDWVFFGVIDWHFRHQRPQQLALALARAGRRVFYVSVNFVDAAQPGFELERLDPALPLFQVFFHLQGPHSVYAGPPDAPTLERLRTGQLALWERAGIQQAVHLVQHPYWFALAAFLPPARLVYDCMDFHAGFDNTGDAHASAEQRLIALADLTIVTSDYLADHARLQGARHVAMIRNAAQFEHFHAAATHDEPPGARPATRRPVLGYYGAIAEWFDPALVARLSAAFPQADIVFIESGGDNLAATFSPELSDLTIYVIDVAAGEKIPRKGGPGITKSDLFVINKTDLAPHVGADLAVMEADTRRMRPDHAGRRPYVMTNLKTRQGLAEVVRFIETRGLLTA
jgi:hypothetical protein